MNKLLKQAATDVVASTKPVVPEPAVTDDVTFQTQEDVAAVEGYVGACHDYAMIESAIDDAEATATKAEVVIAKLENMADEGGLHPQTAAILSMLQDFTFANFGGAETLGLQTVGVESFQDADSRVSATTFAVENFKEGLEKVWKIIKDLIVKIVKSCDQFIKRSGVWVKRAKKRAESLSKAVKDLEGKKKEEQLEVGSKIQYMMVDGAIVGDLPASVKDLSEIVKQASDNKKAVSSIIALGDVAKTGITKLVNDKLDAVSKKKAVEEYTVDAGKALEAANEAQLERFDVKTAEKESRFGGLDTKRSEGILGDKAFFAVSPASEQFAEAASPESEMTFKSMTACELQSVNEEAIYEQDAKFGALDKDQIIAVCNGIVDVCDAIEEYKNEGKDADNLKKALHGAGDDISDVLKDSDENVAVRTLARLTVRSFGNVISAYQKPVIQLQQHAINVAGAHIDFCLKSMSNIVKEEAAA